jgi:YVTN family beta-propeller protein
MMSGPNEFTLKQYQANAHRSLVWPVALLIVMFVITLATDAPAEHLPSPALIVVTNGKGANAVHALDVADLRTNKVVAQIPINGIAREVASSDDGKLAFVTCTSFGRDPKQNPDDTIAVIDMMSQKVLRQFEVGRHSYPHGISYVQGKVYFTAEGFKLVARYDPATDRMDWMQGIGHRGGHLLAISDDGKRVFVPSLDPDSVVEIEASENPPARPYQRYTGVLDGTSPFWTLTWIPLAMIGPEGIALSPDGKEVWILTRGDSAISIVDVSQKQVSHVIHLKNNEDPHRIAFTPDGKEAVTCDSEGNIVVYDTATRKEIKRLNVEDTPGLGAKWQGKKTEDLLISPDGSHAYVTVSGNNCISIVDLRTLELTGGISTADPPSGLAWIVRGQTD